MINTNFYDEQVYFAITFGGQSTLILEPDGINKIANRIPRDPKWFGFWSDFLEDKYGLKFTYGSKNGLSGGGDLLTYIAETVGLGPTSDVFFSIGFKIGNTLQKVNEWRINLSEYESVDYGSGRGYVMTSIEKMPMQGKLKSRMSVPCTINAPVNMDGFLLKQIPVYNLRLHSKTLLQISHCISPSIQLSNPFFDGGGNIFGCCVQPDQSKLSTNELKEVYTQDLGIVNTGLTIVSDPTYTTGLPFTDLISQYTPATSGLLSVKWSGSFDFVYYQGPTAPVNLFIIPRIVVQRSIGGVQTIVSTTNGTPLVFVAPTTDPFNIATAGLADLLPDITPTLQRQICKNILGITFAEDANFRDIPVQAGDNVYVHLLIPRDGASGIPFASGGISGASYQLYNYTNDIKYSQMTTTPATKAPAYRAIDMLNQMVESITGQKNAVISSFFSEGGRGYEFLFTNGYGIRNFSTDIFLPKKSLQEFLEDLQSQWCLAVGIKKQDDKEYLVVEEISAFFKNRVIDTFTETFNWKNKIASKFSYNKVELGYEKFEGLNLIQMDEMCTQGSYLLQKLTYEDNLLTKRSKTIASGYLIEEQRRNQFDFNPGQSLQNDNDLFQVAVVDINQMTIPTVQFTASPDPDRIYFNVNSMAMMPGDKFKIISSTGGAGANVGIEYTIVSQTEGYPAIGVDAYEITPTPTADITFNNVVLITPPSPDEIFAERNQPFEICTGVTDPYTIYNGRLSLKHLLYNWRPVLGIGLYFIDPLSQDYNVSNIFPTLVRMNSLFSSKFLSTETHKGNAGDLTLVENTKVAVIDYMRSGESIFTPFQATCEIKLGWNRMDVIRKALSGELNDGGSSNPKDHGGLVLRDDRGQDWFCHIMDIKYNLFTQIAQLDVQKVKRVTL